MTNKNDFYVFDTLFVDLSPLTAEGSFKFTASGKADIPDDMCPGASRVPAELSFSGFFERRDGSTGKFFLEGTLTAKVSALCAMCLKDTAMTLQAEISEVFSKAQLDAKDSADTEEWSLSGSIADLAPVFRSVILTVLPARVLCREDCKGLCPVCGTDLNESDCGCGMDMKKPRNNMLDALPNSLPETLIKEGSFQDGSNMPER